MSSVLVERSFLYQVKKARDQCVSWAESSSSLDSMLRWGSDDITKSVFQCANRYYCYKVLCTEYTTRMFRPILWLLTRIRTLRISFNQHDSQAAIWIRSRRHKLNKAIYIQYGIVGTKTKGYCQYGRNGRCNYGWQYHHTHTGSRGRSRTITLTPPKTCKLLSVYEKAICVHTDNGA